MPTIYPLAKPQIDNKSLERFLEREGVDGFGSDAETDADRLPEIAGRICYMSFASPRPGGNQVYHKHILSEGHGSIFEHSNLSFILTGVSRNLTHELIRHRAGFAYSQLSQRYVDSSNVKFVIPPLFLKGGYTEEMDVFKRQCIDSLKAYSLVSGIAWAKLERSGIDRKSARKKAFESAREVLPGAAETKIVVTANIRAWRHFIELRGGSGASEEIRRLALMLGVYLKGEAPASFQGYSVEQKGSSTTLKSEYRKV